MYSYSNAIACLAEWQSDCDAILPINMHYSIEGVVKMNSSSYIYGSPRFDIRNAFKSDIDAGFFMAASS